MNILSSQVQRFQNLSELYGSTETRLALLSFRISEEEDYRMEAAYDIVQVAEGFGSVPETYKPKSKRQGITVQDPIRRRAMAAVFEALHGIIIEINIHRALKRFHKKNQEKMLLNEPTTIS